MKQKIEPPNQDELDWIAENLDLAKKIVAIYAKRAELDLDSLDSAVVEWSSRRQEDRIEANALVNALGIAFGQILAQDLRLEWAVVSDEHGTDIAVHGAPWDILVFPTSTMAKRIEKGDAPFFKDLYDHLREDIGKLRKEVH